jgi:hypothetical protein
MRIRHITLAVAMTLFVTTSARAELRHVELKTLGMD